MSTLPQTSLRQRITGKWQIPVLLSSVGLLTLIVAVIHPRINFKSVDEILPFVQQQIDSGLYAEAEELIRALLVDERYDAVALAPVHAKLGDIIFHREKGRGTHSEARLVEMLGSYEQAEADGHRLKGDTYARCGQAYQWLKQFESALRSYEKAIARNAGDSVDIRCRILDLLREEFDPPQVQLVAELDDILIVSEDRPDVMLWAIEHKHDLLSDSAQHDEARGLLDVYRERFEEPEAVRMFDYLTSVTDFHSGQQDDAEIALRDLLGALESRDELHARANWLLGRVVLRDDGPQRPLRAISFFENVLASHLDGPYVVAARLGMAEALSQLERYDDALEYYAQVLDTLPRGRRRKLVDIGVVMASLTLRSRLQHADGHYDSALDYLQLATSLISEDRLGMRTRYLADLARMKSELAKRYRQRAVDEPESSAAHTQRSQGLFRSAAEDHLTLARINHHEESVVAAAEWEAAILFDAGGARQKAAQLLEDFLAMHPHDDRIPQVLFRLAQVFQANGDLDRAVDRYQQCIRDHTRTSPAQDSLLPLTDCFVMQGPEFADQAEQTLLSILEDSPDYPAMFKPGSAIYRGALFKLGDLYSHQGRYEAAIERLDEAVERYPNDDRTDRGTFLLAEAYRKSGLALDRAVAEAGNLNRREEMLQKKAQRLGNAETLYGKVIQRFGQRPRRDLSTIEALQVMLSYGYRADCAFDLGDYESALDRYQEVVRVYGDHPVAMPAYMQIISCLESLGRTLDVPPALRRAQFLTGRIPEDAHDALLSTRTPHQWERFFGWLARTGRYE